MENLLDYNDIAKIMKRSMRHVRERVMKDDQAPAPVIRGRYKESDIKQFLNVLQSRQARDCNRSSHGGGLSSQTSGTDQEHPISELNE